MSRAAVRRVTSAAAVMAVGLGVVVGCDSADDGVVAPAASAASVPDPAPVSTPSTAPTTSTTPTTPATALAAAPPVVAVGVDGDAVLVEGGTTTVLYDGADPREPPDEGEPTAVDRVVRTPDGRTFVSTCCEPVSGVYSEIGADGQVIPASVVYGHGIELSPDGTRMASVGADLIAVADLDAGPLAQSVPSAGAPRRTPMGVRWLDDETLAVIELWQTDASVEVRLLVTPADLGSLSSDLGVVIASGPTQPFPQLAGFADDGSVLVLQDGLQRRGVPTLLRAYDPRTLERRPGSDITLPGPGTSAWRQDGVTTWVALDGTVHVGEATVPGRFTRARPVAD